MSHHRGVQASHGRVQLGHTLWTAVIQQYIRVGGVFHIGQSFSPGGGRDEPQERKDPSQNQILEGPEGEKSKEQIFRVYLYIFINANS